MQPSPRRPDLPPRLLPRPPPHPALPPPPTPTARPPPTCIAVVAMRTIVVAPTAAVQLTVRILQWLRDQPIKGGAV